MASAEKLRREKEIDHALGKLGAGDTPAERAHVRVVVRAAHLRAEAVGQQRAANAGDLVRRERHADARAADKDTLFVLPFRNAARGVAEGKYEKGILVCGTGIGMSLAANKIPGIRCALLSDCFSAEMCRAHNNANMCALGGRVTGPELAKRMVDLFLTTEFLGGRHADRVNMISALENHDR